MKNTLKKIGLFLVMALMIAAVVAMPVAADVVSGLQAATTELENTGLVIVKTVVVPIGIVIAAIVLVVLIISMMGKRRNGEDFKPLAVGIGITVAVLVLLATFGAWGPLLFTTTP